MTLKEKSTVEFHSKCPRGPEAAGFFFILYLPALLVEALLKRAVLCSCLGLGLTSKHKVIETCVLEGRRGHPTAANNLGNFQL